MLTQEQKQEFFNKAVEGLASQGFTRARGQVTCQYRTADGKKCALGQLLPDELYEEEYDHFPTNGFRAVLTAIGCNPDDNATMQFFSRLQEAHDNAFKYDYTKGGPVDDPDLMKDHLRAFANKYELTTPEALR